MNKIHETFPVFVINELTRSHNIATSALALYIGHGTWDLGLGTWDMGHGTWDMGLGTWDLGLGTWDLGLGI